MLIDANSLGYALEREPRFPLKFPAPEYSQFEKANAVARQGCYRTRRWGINAIHSWHKSDGSTFSLKSYHLRENKVKHVLWMGASPVWSSSHSSLVVLGWIAIYLRFYSPARSHNRLACLPFWISGFRAPSARGFCSFVLGSRNIIYDVARYNYWIFSFLLPMIQ